MDSRQLFKQNMAFADTYGVSENNQDQGFVPAFKDTVTEQVELARFPDGRIAPMHLIAGLPADWAAEVDETGTITRLRSQIVAGFFKDGEFYTRDQAILACAKLR